MGERWTPGPWEYHSLSASVIQSGDPDGNSVCLEAGDADGHLIAAAPELYEALEGLLEMTDDDQWGAEAEAAQRVARAALAKARGES